MYKFITCKIIYPNFKHLFKHNNDQYKKKIIELRNYSIVASRSKLCLNTNIKIRRNRLNRR